MTIWVIELDTANCNPVKPKCLPSRSFKIPKGKKDLKLSSVWLVTAGVVYHTMQTLLLLDLAGYCRRFVPHYADITAPRSGWLLQALCTTLCRNCCSSVWLVTTGVGYLTMQTLLLLGLVGYCRRCVPHYADIAALRSGWLLQAFCTTLCRHCCSSVWLVTAGVVYHTADIAAPRSGWLLQALCTTLCRHCCSSVCLVTTGVGYLTSRHCCFSVWLVTAGVVYHSMQILLLLGLAGYCRRCVPHYADIAAPRSGWVLQALCTSLCRHCCSSV